jgi:acyl carrier protein phosphodiesterase
LAVHDLEKPIGRAWRRMRFQRFLGALVWCWGICLALVVVALGYEWLAHRPLPGPDWLPFAIAGGVGFIVAVLIAILTGPSRIDAAVAIDRAFHLHERLSTTLTLPPELRETPAGQALIADTIRHVADLDIGAEFGLRWPRRAWLPLIPGALALGLLWAPEWAQQIAKANRVSAELSKLDQEVVAKKATALSKKIAAERKELDKTKFPEAEKLLAEIERATKELAKAPPSQRDKALIELNKLSDAVKERQKQLGGSDQIKRQLQQLKEMSNEGPADQFAKELAKGDFQKAAQELKQLQQRLASGQMTEKEKQALQKQLGEMKKQLEKLATLEERKKQLEEARKNGGLSQKQYEQEMAKLQQQSKNLQQLQKLAQKLGEAQQQMGQGDMKKAAEALSMSQQQLQQMAQQLQEIEALDGALADLQDAKNGMNADGFNQLGENMASMNAMGNRPGNGNGLGRGRGFGDRPEAPDETALYNTKTKSQYGKGKAVLESFAPPIDYRKGVSIIDPKAEEEAARERAAEALTNQKIPKNIQKHIRGYYDQINKGK